MRAEQLAEFETVKRLGYDISVADEAGLDIWISVCRRCGALVLDRQRHREWHYEQIIGPL